MTPRQLSPWASDTQPDDPGVEPALVKKRDHLDAQVRLTLAAVGAMQGGMVILFLWWVL